MARHALTAIGITAGIVAFVGFMALFEHFANLKGAEWLNRILPFGLAASPVWLSILSMAALAVALLTLRIAKTV